MRVLVTAAARRSDRVIVDAASTGTDVRTLLRVPAERIDVCPLGYGTHAPANVMAATEVRRAVDAGDRPIVLCVSAKRRHKNLARLIAATALIPADRRPVVVIVGYPTPYELELQDQISELKLRADIRLLDWIDADLLNGLYAAARCLVFPSLYEGFGLPVLEAMSRGLPVICSDRGSLAEVAGSAALTVDPLSVPHIAAAMERLMADDAEVARLRALGLHQASKFTWAATATATLGSYARAL
jgi:glycosyltransferase involved in cell wall biosynthesis